MNKHIPVNDDRPTNVTIFAKRSSSSLCTLIVAALVSLIGAVPLTTQADCPTLLHQRTPEAVLSDLAAAIAVGDLDAALCNYASDAVMIGDGGIDLGHEQIRSTLEFNLLVFDGTLPQVIQQVVVETPIPHTFMVRQLFTIDTECIIVPDGVTTYVIRRGLIQSQTTHGFPVFLCF